MERLIHYIIPIFVISSFIPTIASKRCNIEDVTVKQLSNLQESEQFIAVFWYGKNCKTCDRMLSVLEKHCSDLEDSGVNLVKLNDKKTAKRYGVTSFPALTYLRGGSPLSYEGDLNDEENLVQFLGSPEALNVPDQIEKVNSAQMQQLLKEKSFIVVFFYIPQQEESSDAISHLELIDEKVDKLGVAFVKINDLELVEEYQLEQLPALVYYRHSTPIVYQGDLTDENKVLEWIIENRSTGVEGDDGGIEETTLTSLEALIPSVEHLAVLFYDASSRKADQLLESFESVDKECDSKGIHFVRVHIEDPENVASLYGIQRIPSLVYFHSQVPNVFDGPLMDGLGVINWLGTQLDSNEIEEITGTMLSRLIKDTKRLVVLFCKYIGYAIIALTHTCFLLRNYDSATKKYLPTESVVGMAREE